jgi:hypothetical protein
MNPLNKARWNAVRWYRRVEEKVLTVASFAQLITVGTGSWARGEFHHLRVGNPLVNLERAKNFACHPVRHIRDAIRRRELQALSELWDYSNLPTHYPRKYFPEAGKLLVTSGMSPLNDANGPSVRTRETAFTRDEEGRVKYTPPVIRDPGDSPMGTTLQESKDPEKKV